MSAQETAAEQVAQPAPLTPEPADGSYVAVIAVTGKLWFRSDRMASRFPDSNPDARWFEYGPAATGRASWLGLVATGGAVFVLVPLTSPDAVVADSQCLVCAKSDMPEVTR